MKATDQINMGLGHPPTVSAAIHYVRTSGEIALSCMVGSYALYIRFYLDVADRMVEIWTLRSFFVSSVQVLPLDVSTPPDLYAWNCRDGDSPRPEWKFS